MRDLNVNLYRNRKIRNDDKYDDKRVYEDQM